MSTDIIKKFRETGKEEKSELHLRTVECRNDWEVVFMHPESHPLWKHGAWKSTQIAVGNDRMDALRRAKSRLSRMIEAVNNEMDRMELGDEAVRRKRK